MEYVDSMIRFGADTHEFSTDQQTWQSETVLLGTRNDQDAFQHFEKLQQLYPQAQSHIFDEEGGHHMLFLFPEEYTRVLQSYVEVPNNE
jgi:hypothetical protein